MISTSKHILQLSSQYQEKPIQFGVPSYTVYPAFKSLTFNPCLLHNIDPPFNIISFIMFYSLTFGRKNSKIPSEAKPFFLSGFFRRSSWERRPCTQCVNLWATASKDCRAAGEENQVFVGAVFFLGGSFYLLNCQISYNKHQEFSNFNFCKKQVRQESWPRLKLHIFSRVHFTSAFLSAGGRGTGTWFRPQAINKRQQFASKGLSSNQYFSGASARC